MPRNHNTAAGELVIVESPAMATTLDQYPGPGRRVVAADAVIPVLRRLAGRVSRGSGN